MPLQSMTGFARSEGTSGRYRWSWELRSVNGKGLDLRLRLPNGLEALEADAKRTLSSHLSRGNLQAGLSLSVAETGVEAVVNRDALEAVLKLRTQLGPEIVDPAALPLDALLSMRGVVELKEPADSEEAIAARNAAIMVSLETAAAGLAAMRAQEGEALRQILSSQIDRIEQLTATVEADPSRLPAEIARKLETQIAELLDNASSLDRDRLHMEAALLATKADVREEIDRLKAHVEAARALLAAGGPIGRKLDFLAQEFNRESNTICSKSNSVAVTSAGIELKVVIDQFREQVQNLE